MARRTLRWFIPALVSISCGGVGLIGCSADDGSQRSGFGNGGIGSGAQGNAGGVGQGGTTSGGTGAGATGNGGLITTGGNDGGNGDEGCKKVDFLFIIDNSVSMGDQQAALIQSFPGFINTIQTTLAAKSDYHIMVVDTDDVTRCTPSNCQSGAMSANNLCKPKGYACDASNFDACDTTMGAGVVNPAGDGASNQKCPIFGGNRYFIEGEPDLPTAFSCAALVGLAGHPSERPMDALVAAMAPAINAPGGCNAGFLRDDAILVITFLSDDPNVEDSGTPQQWYDAVAAAKKGDTDSVVVLGLTPNFMGCSNKAGAGQHWSDFIKLWGNRGLEGSICSSEYTSFFNDAVSVIDQTCDEFMGPS